MGLLSACPSAIRLRDDRRYFAVVGRIFGVVVGLALFVPAVAGAQPIVDGQSLRARCATIQLANPSGGLACRGYVGAVADILADGNTVNGLRACLPEGTTREALVKVVRSWLDGHADLLNSKAHRLTAQAISERYPCPTSE